MPGRTDNLCVAQLPLLSICQGPFFLKHCDNSTARSYCLSRFPYGSPAAA